MTRRRLVLRGSQAEVAPMAETARVVELLLDGRAAEAAHYLAAAERASRAAADRLTPAFSIWTGAEPAED